MPLTAKICRNAQKCGFCTPKTKRFCVVGLLLELRLVYDDNVAETAIFQELP